MGSERGRRILTLPVGRLVALIVLVAIGTSTTYAADRVISPLDVIDVAVDGQPTLTAKYSVSADGSVELPLVGRVEAAGLAPETLAASLRERLSVFIINPQVQLTVSYRKRVFVFGDVKAPGSYDLTTNMTLLEALTRAGYAGASEVVVVRRRDFPGPVAQDDPAAETFRVNLRRLETDLATGDLSRNVVLSDGDTIYVPTNDPNAVYVSGEVRKPGAYTFPEGTTILQAVSEAGGATERAARARVRIVRFVGGEQKDLKAQPDDAVEPGDTVVVPERIAFPAIDVGVSAADNPAGRIKFGRALFIRPAVALKQVGVDSNVFSEGQATSDFTVVAGPRLEAGVDLRRVQARATGDVDFVYFRRFTNERAVNRSVTAAVDIRPVERLRLHFGGSATDTRDRLNLEVDRRAHRFEHTADASIEVRPWRRLEFEVSGREFNRELDRNVEYFGVNLRETLTERIRTVTATARVGVTAVSSVVFSGSASTHRFALFPRKDADATEFSMGGLFRPGALIVGEARVGYLRYVGLDPAAPRLEGAVGGAELFWDPKDRTRFGVTLERTAADTFQPEFPYAVVDRAGGSIRQGLLRRFDVLLEGYREKYMYREFLPSAPATVRNERFETTDRYASELGVRLGPIRVGCNVTYYRRVAATGGPRNYHALRTMVNVSYGVFQARGL